MFGLRASGFRILGLGEASRSCRILEAPILSPIRNMKKASYQTLYIPKRLNKNTVEVCKTRREQAEAAEP